MKIVLGVPWFLPEFIGGTEVYVAGLAEELQKLGVECVVALPGKVDTPVSSTYRNIRTIRYPSRQPQGPLRDVLASAPAESVFRELLAREQPDIYHQHDWSVHCGLDHLRAAKEMDIPTLFTVHLPKLICIRTTMLLDGKSQCDGRIDGRRCAQCFMQSRGVPRRVAGLLAKLPDSVSADLMRVPTIGRVLSARRQAERAFAGLKSVADNVDCMVTVCQWLREALLANGIPERKIRFVKSGVSSEFAASAYTVAKEPSPILRIGFIGRWNQAKGLHVLIAALQRLPKTIEFRLTALAAGGTDKATIVYRTRIEKMIAGLPQYQLFSDQPRDAVNRLFESIDVLAVPSQWLENAPLVVLEANAWKVPVVGSDLGGIREMVRHHVDGLLVPHADIDAWTAALRKLAQEPALVQKLRSGISPVRTMADTARDMIELYRMHAGGKAKVALTDRLRQVPKNWHRPERKRTVAHRRIIDA